MEEKEVKKALLAATLTLALSACAADRDHPSSPPAIERRALGVRIDALERRMDAVEALARDAHRRVPDFPGLLLPPVEPERPLPRPE